MKRIRNNNSAKPHHLKFFNHMAAFGILGLLLGLPFVLVALQQNQDQRSLAAPSAALQVDKLNQSFTGAGYTSEYHIYAAGLDWTKPVGLLMYTDGSGENGLKNPTGSYLLGGANGMVAVAKKHNMVLVTPMSPNKACTDGSVPESCWYEGDSPGYAKWAEALITSIQSQYGIDKRRVAVGGYSSGAEFTMGWWIPSGAAQRTMDDGVLVAISYGGGPHMNATAYSSTFKSNVHLNWNGGDADESITAVRRGHTNYTQAGFQTSLDVLPGVDHDRSGEFGKIMDAMITKHVIPATGTVPNVSVSPTYFCGGSQACVPTISQAAVTQAPAVPPAFETPVPVISSEAPLDPILSGAPNQFPINQNPNGNSNNQGLIAIILAFFQLIISFFMSLFNR